MSDPADTARGGSEQAIYEAIDRAKAGKATAADDAFLDTILLVKWQVARLRVERASADLALVLLQRVVEESRDVLSDKLKQDIMRVMDILNGLGTVEVVTAAMRGNVATVTALAESVASSADAYREALLREGGKGAAQHEAGDDSAG